MNVLLGEDLCERLGLTNMQSKPGSVVRVSEIWWSFDHGRTAFGYGDLDDKDLKRIYNYLVDDYQPGRPIKIFTGWGVNTRRKSSDKLYVVIRISMPAGITYPYEARLELSEGLL